jgi:hypothetical protein
MNDRVMVFTKVKNASIIVNNKKYVIKLHKHGSYFIPYVYMYGYCRAVIIRIYRGEMFAALGELEYSNVKEHYKSISLLEYFTKNIKNYEIDNLKFDKISEIRNSIAKCISGNNSNIKVVLCTEILLDDNTGLWLYNMGVDVHNI